MTKFLDNFKIILFGTSHSKYIGAEVMGIPKGIKLDIGLINGMLIKRNPHTLYNTKRKDEANIIFLSGVDLDVTDGNNVVFILENNNIKSKDYNKHVYRLNHADYVSYKKFGEDYDYKGGGPFSGRMTAPIVAIGEIARQILEYKKFNFDVYAQIKNVLGHEFKSLCEYQKDYIDQNLDEELSILEENKKKLVKILDKSIKKKETVGAKVEVLVKGINENFGNIYFDSFEAKLSSALFSIPGLKGINFGIGEEFYLKEGSKLVEDFEIKNNKIIPLTNINGGINGGIINGYQDIYFTCIIKPPMSLNQEIPLVINENNQFKKVYDKIGGRHDSFIGNKSTYVIKAWINIIMVDFILDSN